MATKHILITLAAAGLLAASVSCGHSGKHGAAPSRSTAHESHLSLDAVLREIDAYPVPKGVSADAWVKLTAELKRLLVARAAGGKTISTGPQGPQNAVTDLTADNNGWGTVCVLRWTEALAGDCNNDGNVDIADLQPIAAHYGETSSGPGSWAYLADANDDGNVDITDLQPIAANYGARLQGYQVWRGHFNGTTTEWEATTRPNTTASHTLWSKDRAVDPYIPATSRPTYEYDDDATQVADKVNIRYKVIAYGDGEPGAESNEAAVPPLPTYIVSGTVLEGTNPLPGVTMTLTPGGLTATTQSDGTFSIPGVLDGGYTLTPAKMGVGFTPASRTVVVFGADVPGQDFTAAQPHAISGTVLESGLGLAGVVVTLTPGPITATTQADGTYSIADVAYGTYTLVPRNLQYAFTPPARTVVVTSADVSGQDFAGVGGQPTLAWPKFRGDSANSGVSPYVGPQTPNLLWSGYTGGSLEQSSPVLGPDGTVYVASRQDHRVFALSPSDGSIKWCFLAGAWIFSDPAVSADGTVFIGDNDPDGRLYALNPLDGSVRWQYKFVRGTSSSAAIGPDGLLYIGSDDGCVYSLDPSDGSLVQRLTTGDTVSCPAITTSGMLYVGCDDGRVVAFDIHDGTQKWTYQTGSNVRTSVGVGQDGNVYVGSFDNYVYALNASDGTLAWKYATRAGVGSSPAAAPNDTVCVGSSDGNLYALNSSDGSVKWTFASGPDWVSSSPAVGADGTLYVSANGYVYALNGADGTLNWSYYGGIYGSSPAIGADGTLYVAGYAGTIGGVYAFSP